MDKDLNIDKRRILFFRTKLLKWFNQFGRPLPWRGPRQSYYRLIIAELLLQRTRAEVVAGLYHQFFRQYPTWAALARAKRSELVLLIRPLGLWQRRVPVLIQLGKILNQNNGRLPADRREIEKLPGVGQYIANAIEMFRWNTPRPLIDVNMSRIIERHFGPRSLADIRFDPFLQQLAQKIVNCKKPLQMNWAILDFGALVCTARNPKCTKCPISENCRNFLASPRKCPAVSEKL